MYVNDLKHINLLKNEHFATEHSLSTEDDLLNFIKSTFTYNTEKSEWVNTETEMSHGSINIRELQTINLTDKNISIDNISKLMTVISKSKNPLTLKTLNLSGINMNNSDLPKVLSNLPELENLNLSRTSMTSTDVKALSDAIIHNALNTPSKLTQLNLTGNNIGTVGAKALASAFIVNTLCNTPMLTRLNLNETNLTDDGVLALVGALFFIPTLNDLSLYDNDMTETSAIELANALKHVPNLTELNLGYNRILDAGTIKLADALKNVPKLTSLNLENTDITDNGVIALSDALKNVLFLTSLNLSSNSITHNGAQALSLALKYTDLSTPKYESKLTSLALNSTDIGKNGAVALASALFNVPNLTNLSLNNAKIQDDGVIALAGALKYVPLLTILNLDGNNITNTGAGALAGSLNILPMLRTLSLTNNNEINTRWFYSYTHNKVNQNKISILDVINLNGKKYNLTNFDKDKINKYAIDEQFFGEQSNVRHIINFDNQNINLANITDSIKMKILMYDIVSKNNIILNVSGTYDEILNDLPIAPIYDSINITRNLIPFESIQQFCANINKLYDPLSNTPHGKRPYPKITYMLDGNELSESSYTISKKTLHRNRININSSNHGPVHADINVTHNRIVYTTHIKPDAIEIEDRINEYFTQHNIKITSNVPAFTIYINKYTHTKHFEMTTYTVTINFEEEVMKFVNEHADELLKRILERKKSNALLYILLIVTIIVVFGLLYNKPNPVQFNKK